jgi:putative transcriptional regulator
VAKRDMFTELMEGIEAMGAGREGTVTLRSHSVEAKAPPPVDAAYVKATRRQLHMSAPVFARTLRVSPRTLERWEQGQEPGAAAQVLIALVRRHPDTLERIAKLETSSRGRAPKKRVGRRLGGLKVKRLGRRNAVRPRLT